MFGHWKSFSWSFWKFDVIHWWEGGTILALPGIIKLLWCNMITDQWTIYLCVEMHTYPAFIIMTGMRTITVQYSPRHTHSIGDIALETATLVVTPANWIKGIIRPFPKILELFSRNGRQSWQMAWNEVFCLKIALLANARPSKLTRLPASTCAKQIASAWRKSL